MKKVYYSRALDGKGHGEILKDYNYVKGFLNRHNMILINEYNKEFREKLELRYADAEAVVFQNLYFLRNSDILIVDLSITSHQYVGCIGNMIYAKMYNVYVITVVGDNEYDKHHWTVYHSDKIIKNLDEALDIASNLKFKKAPKMSADKEASIARWDKIHSTIGGRNTIVYDEWLNEFRKIIKDCITPIIDLGCGSGNDSLYLIEREKNVYSCDFSSIAIGKIKENLPEATPILFDMTEGFPFRNSFSDIILADLSLHYFSKAVTKRIIKEIRRVLKTGGHFIFRVNSVADVNYGSMQGNMVEENFYKVRGTTKRFFDRDSIMEFFEGWEMVYLEEGIMPKSDIRACLNEGDFSKMDKKLWTCVVKKIK